MKLKRCVALLLCCVTLLSLSPAMAAADQITAGSGTATPGTNAGSGSTMGYLSPANLATYGAGLRLSVVSAPSDVAPNTDADPEAFNKSFKAVIEKCTSWLPDTYTAGATYMFPAYATNPYEVTLDGTTPKQGSAITNYITMQAPADCDNTLGVAARNAAGVDTKLNPQLPTNYWQGVIAATSRSSAEIICAKLFSGSSNGFNDGVEVERMNTRIQKFLSCQATDEEDVKLFLNYCGLVATVAITLPGDERESVAKRLDNMCANYFQGKGFTPLLIVGEITYPSWWNNAGIENCNNWWTPKVALGGQTGTSWNNSLTSNDTKSAVLQHMTSHNQCTMPGDGYRVAAAIYGDAAVGASNFTQHKTDGGYKNPIVGTMIKAVSPDLLAAVGLGNIKPNEGIGFWGLSKVLTPMPNPVDLAPVGSVSLHVEPKIVEKAKGSYTQTYNVTVTVNLDASGVDKDGNPVTSFASGLRWMSQNAPGSQPYVDVFIKQADAITAVSGEQASALINSTYGYSGDGADISEGISFKWSDCNAYLALKNSGLSWLQLGTPTSTKGVRITITDTGAAADYFATHDAVFTFTGECPGSGTLATDTSKQQQWFKVGASLTIFTPQSVNNTSSVVARPASLSCEPKYDYATITAGPSDTPYYYSTYQQPYSEFKQGTVPTSGGGSSETFNSMTGTPTFTECSTRSDFDGTAYENNGHYYQYFASGGSEFVVQFDGEYVESANASRTYTATFSNVNCHLYHTQAHIPCPGHPSENGTTYCGHHGCPTHATCTSNHSVGDTFTWTQSVKGFSYVKITNLKVWKLSEAKLDGTRELLDTDEVTATVQANAPTVFYNIAGSNNSASGRLVYTFETAQNDTVRIPGYPKSSNNDCTSHRSNNQVTLDADTASLTCGATCVSDFIVLRTTNGDQSILYYEYKSKNEARINTGGCVAEAIEFDKVPYATIWTGNSQTSKGSGLPADGITYGGYNGNYSSVGTKYQSTGHPQNINLESTTAYQNKSGRFKPVAKPTQKLRLLNDRLVIPDTKQNGEYILGNSQVFYENIINYGTGTANFPIVPQSDFGGRRGFVIQTTYSPNHDKINDIVVYNPVSNSNAMIISLPEERDQRVKVSNTGAVDITEVCPGDSSCPYLKNECTVSEHIHTEDCYKKISYTVAPPYNAHKHTAACTTTGWNVTHSSGCAYAGQTHFTTSQGRCSQCGHSCGGTYTPTSRYTCNNLPLNAHMVTHVHTEDCFTRPVVSRTTGTEGKWHINYDYSSWIRNDQPCAGIDCAYCKNNMWFTDNAQPIGYPNSAYYPIGRTNSTLLSYSDYPHQIPPQAIMLPPGKYEVLLQHGTAGTNGDAGMLLGYINLPTSGLLHTKSESHRTYLFLNDKQIAYCGSFGVVSYDTAVWENCSTGRNSGIYTNIGVSTGPKTYVATSTLSCGYTSGSTNSTQSSGGALTVGQEKTYNSSATVTLSPGTYQITAAGARGGSHPSAGIVNNHSWGGAGGIYTAKIHFPGTTTLTASPGKTSWDTSGGGMSSVYLYSSGYKLLVGGGGGGYWNGPGKDASLTNGTGSDGSPGTSRGGPGAGGTCHASSLMSDITTGYNHGDGYVTIKMIAADSTTTAKVGDVVQVYTNEGYTLYKSVLSCNDPHHSYTYNWKLYTYGCKHTSGNICSGRSCTDTTDIIFPTQEQYTLAQCAAGYIVKHTNGDVHLSTTNNGTCSYCSNSYKTLLSAAQSTDRTPDPSEYCCFEYGDSRCWAPCGNAANHQRYVTEITSAGTTYTMGDFINLDWAFKVYFPNTGDFYGTGAAWSSTTTAERGKGYTNNMDTTEWVKSKWIEFPFAVLYAGATYKEYERIYLSVPQTVFDFYVPLQDFEAAQVEIRYGTVAINAQNGETLECGTNKDHNIQAITYMGKPDAHHHNADKRSYIDVVGRIGALTLEDTGDFRFANLFKQATSGWIVDNVVHKVDFTKPNYLLTDPIDVRGVSIPSTGAGGNTYGSKAERSDPSRLLSLPLSPAKNNVTALQRQPLRLGYDCYFDLTTLGNYYGATLIDEGGTVTGQQLILIKPHYYRLDLETGNYSPVDVYMEVNGKKVLINDFDSNTVAYSGTDANVSLNWRDENARRNFSGYEVSYTNNVKSSYDWVQVPNGSSWVYGNYNLLNLTQRNRTFIGSETTYGWNKDPSNKLPNVRASLQGARWHFNVGLPSSACFVYSGQEASKANIEACASGSCVVFCALEIYAEGGIWTLGYDGSNVNIPFRVVPGGPLYDPVIPYPSSLSPKGEEQPIVAVFSINKSSKSDLNVTGTH